MALLTNKEYLELHEMIKEVLGEDYLEMRDVPRAKAILREEKTINDTYVSMAYGSYFGYDLTDYDRYPKFVRKIRRMLGMPKLIKMRSDTRELTYLGDLVALLECQIIPNAKIPDTAWGTGRELREALAIQTSYLRSLVERYENDINKKQKERTL